MGNSVRIKLDFKKMPKNVKKVLERAIDKQVLKECGEQIVEMNLKAVRSGIKPDGKPLEPLSAKWIARRRKISKFNPKGAAFSPARSNLTFTGQLLNAVSFFVDAASKSVTLHVMNSRRNPYYSSKAKSSGSKPPTNKKLAEYLAKKGIVFVGLTDQAKERCNKIITRKVRSLLSSFK